MAHFTQILRDRKRKKFVSAEKGQPKVKKMRTEEGTLLPVSYNSGRYEKWKKNQRLDSQRHQLEEQEETEEGQKGKGAENRRRMGGGGGQRKNGGQEGPWHKNGKLRL